MGFDNSLPASSITGGVGFEMSTERRGSIITTALPDRRKSPQKILDLSRARHRVQCTVSVAQLKSTVSVLR